MKERINSIDFVRGLVMVFMALDHVRDYFHADAFLYSPTDLSQTNVMLYITRWITHLCAPVFLFLSGTSAFISGAKKSKKELSVFLIKRGLWLIFLELTLIGFAWYFDPYFRVYNFLVIWVIGVSMIFLAGFIHLPIKTILTISLLIIFGHNLLDSITVTENTFSSFLWALLHQFSVFEFSGKLFFVGYPILPWVAVMSLGYCFGMLYQRYTHLERKQKLITYGVSSIVLFGVLRVLNVYGDPVQWTVQSTPTFTLLSFFNISKYPPSLLYLLITLGIALILLAYTEKIQGVFATIMITFGKVPMFYYLLHLFIIHVFAMIAAELSGFSWSDMVLTFWVTEVPQLDGYGFSLPIVYAVWLVVLLILYPLCKWYVGYKENNRLKWWLSYV